MKQLVYFSREAAFYFGDNKRVSLVTIITISFSMLILGLFLLFYMNLSGWVENLRSEIRVLLYLRDEVSSSELSEIRSMLESEVEILQVDYVSKTQALQEFAKSLADSQMLLKELGENPLPASFELKIDPNYHTSEIMAELVRRLGGIPGVEEVQYGQEWVENIENWVRIFRIVATGIGLVLAFTVIPIIANTIQLTLTLRKGDIELLKLLGGTRSFIGIPFVIQGGFIGMIGTAFSLLLLLVLFQMAYTYFRGLEWLLPVVGNFFFLPASWMIGLLMMGVSLGCIGSFWSFRRWG